MIEKLLSILEGELSEETIADLNQHKEEIVKALSALKDTNGMLQDIHKKITTTEEPEQAESFSDVLDSIKGGTINE